MFAMTCHGARKVVPNYNVMGPVKAENTHMETKKKLIDYVNRENNIGMGTDVFTIGFARRAVAYKRADLPFTDVERLLCLK